MKPLPFFRTPEVVRLLARAARCTTTPLSLHVFERGREGLRVLSFGHCAACRYVAQRPRGNAACRTSREAAGAEALRLASPVPFFCHMGFADIAVSPLPDVAPGFMLTFGPYCPAEEPRSLEADALNGLTQLDACADEDFSAALKEVPIVPAATVPGVAEWTIESLRWLWHQLQGERKAEPIPEPPALKTVRRKRSHVPLPDTYQAAPIAAALAGGSQNRARALVRSGLSESRSAARAKIAVKRARAVALVAAVLEAAERSETGAAACWERFPTFLGAVGQARGDLQLTDAAMDVLSILKRRAAREVAETEGYTELNRMLMARLTEGITLNEVAAQLGQHPTAITHRLQRKFGLSFSEYVGRLRIDRAKELLRRTRLSVTEVARRVGITDVSNFGKLFQKFEAMAPRKYRDQFGRKR
jgi:AraC-like DNA-binding protein/ligand-binding sensor protein